METHQINQIAWLICVGRPYSRYSGSPWKLHAQHRKESDALWSRFKLEVNHIEPRNGKGYRPGCHHHLDNLETLCHPCHVAITNEQRATRRAQAV